MVFFDVLITINQKGFTRYPNKNVRRVYYLIKYSILRHQNRSKASHFQVHMNKGTSGASVWGQKWGTKDAKM